MKSRPMKNHPDEQVQQLIEKLHLLELSNRELQRKSTFFEMLIRGLPGVFSVFALIP